MGETLNIGIVTDIHHGADAGTKVGTAALPLLNNFSNWSSNLALDFVVDLGDRINNAVDSDLDFRLTSEVAAAFSTIQVPVGHILGNHDNHDLARSAAESAMQTSFSSWGRDVNGYHLVFWNADTCIKGRKQIFTGKKDLAWLADDLASTDLPTVIFTHFPLDEGSMIGNFYFEEHFAQLANYANASLARDIIEQDGKTILCLSGHAHWNACNTIDGIHYVTVQSMTESFTTWPHPSGAYALVEIGEQIKIEVFGRDPAYYRLPIRKPGAHWANLSRTFAPRPEKLLPWMQDSVAATAGKDDAK